MHYSLEEVSSTSTTTYASSSRLLSDHNIDFKPGSRVQLTRYNAAEKGLLLLANPTGIAPLATSADQLRPYANTCGVLALPRVDDQLLHRYRDAVLQTASKVHPIYD